MFKLASRCGCWCLSSNVTSSLKFHLATLVSLTDAPVRVRFAPSPTGYLHLGGLRTALYNYLFTRSRNGSFILRIEDTDQTRLIPGAVESLTKTLQWIGINIDEGPAHGGCHGPYIQSMRLPIYHEHAHKLLQNSSVYHCFCSSKRLDLLRKEALSRGEIPKYDNRCRHLSADDVKARLSNDEKYVLRFKLEHYAKPWRDLVFGPIVYDVASIEGDPVVIKSDGYPTYHFANVVDDHLMGITHVLRGVEWQVSTTKHILLYNAFGWQPPLFGHLPLLMNKDGKKLSKRQSDVHVDQYEKLGYFPEALLNLLTNMGSGFNVKETAGMIMEELISHFNLAKVNTNSTRIDFDRLPDFNRMHFQNRLKNPQTRRQIIRDIKRTIQCHAAERNLAVDDLTDERISRVLELSQDRICLLTDLLRPDYEYAWLAPNYNDIGKLSENPVVTCDILTQINDALSRLESHRFDHTLVLATLGDVVQTNGWTNSRFMKLLRQCLCLPLSGPPVVDVMTVLGKEATLERLHKALHTFSSTTTVKIVLDKNPQEMIAKVNELQKKLETMREFVEKLPGIDLSKEEQQRQMEVLRQQLITKTELLKKYKNVDKF